MRAIAFSTAAAAALVLVYLALGGASYAPAKPTDPCATRDLRQPQGVEAVAEQIVLSGLDGAACKLGVSREDVVLAFGSRAALERFGREHDVTPEELEQARARRDRPRDRRRRRGRRPQPHGGPADPRHRRQDPGRPGDRPPGHAARVTAVSPAPLLGNVPRRSLAVSLLRCEKGSLTRLENGS